MKWVLGAVMGKSDDGAHEVMILRIAERPEVIPKVEHWLEILDEVLGEEDEVVEVSWHKFEAMFTSRKGKLFTLSCLPPELSRHLRALMEDIKCLDFNGGIDYRTSVLTLLDVLIGDPVTSKVSEGVLLCH